MTKDVLFAKGKVISRFKITSALRRFKFWDFGIKTNLPKNQIQNTYNSLIKSYDLAKNPKCIVECFKEARSLGKINIHSSIYWEHNTQTINIFSDSGRPLRPLLKIKDGSMVYNNNIQDNLNTNNISWFDLTLNMKDKNNHCIEDIDPYETNNCIVSMDINDDHKQKNSTHCEIHPSLILGPCFLYSFSSP